MMKKLTYLLSIMFAVALLSMSCEKEDPIVPEQTLAELYPDWVNLTWVSTNGNSDPTVLPRISFSISTNVIIFDIINSNGTYHFEYEGFEATSTSARLYDGDGFDHTFDILTPPDATKIKLRWNNDEYVLQIN